MKRELSSKRDGQLKGLLSQTNFPSIVLGDSDTMSVISRGCSVVPSSSSSSVLSMSSVTLVTAGPNNVGKTALITRFCNDTFNEVSYCWHPYANLTALFWQEDAWFVASMMQEARFFLGGCCIVSLHSQLCIDRFLAAVHELQGISLCPSQQLTKILVVALSF